MRVGSEVCEGAVGPRTQESGNVCHPQMVNKTSAALSADGQDQTRAGGGWDPCTQSRRLALHSCQSSSQHRMRSDCPLGLSLASGSSLMATVRPRCRGEGVSPAFTGRRGRELTTPAVGLRSRRCVVKPDPITPHGQSSRGAAEGEGRFPTAKAFCFKSRSLYYGSFV